MLYDIFVCHASEDKESFVRPLAKALRAQHVEVWFDEFSLELGDSLRRSIDNGLRQSRYGILVLSQAFFNKKWPQYELDGLTEIEMRGNDKVLLPIWHGIDHSDVVTYSPSLANRIAISSSEGLEKVVASIIHVVRPNGSPLIHARDLLLQRGVTPPVITAPYWLEVVEASNRANGFGAVIPDESIWGRWTFPIPPKEGGAQRWGERLAWAALQMNWSQQAEETNVSLLTPPEEVLTFINTQPGLYDMCMDYPDLLIEYAPQLTISGFSGDFEKLFAEMFTKTLEYHRQLIKQNSKSGSSMTIHKQVPLCDEKWALRHPTFGGFEPSHIACSYFNGSMFGPTVSPYEHVDHLVWLMSDASSWLPENIHQFLKEGMAIWARWPWYTGDWPSAGALVDALYGNDNGKNFKWNSNIEDDVICRFQTAIHTLHLTETAEQLLALFISYDFIGKLISSRFERQKKYNKR